MSVELDLFDTSRRHVLPRRCYRSIDVDAATGVVHDVNVEARVARVDRGPGDAKIGSETSNKDRVDLALLEVARQTGASFFVCFQESRVAVDIVVEAFANDQFGLRNIDILGNCRTFGALNAMIRPQHLIAIGELDHFEGFLAFVAGCERNVMCGVPILRHHHVFETLGDAVDDRDYLIAVFDRQTAARQETILHVDNDQRT